MNKPLRASVASDLHAEVPKVERQSDRVEEFTLSGDEVVAKVKELINEGNVRRLIIKNEEGRTLLEVPLTIGVIGAALLPVFAAIGALAALATRCTIVVERAEPQSSGEPPSSSMPGDASVQQG